MQEQDPKDSLPHRSSKHHHKVFYSFLSKLVVEAVAMVQALKKKGHNSFVWCTTEKISSKELGGGDKEEEGQRMERGQGWKENLLQKNSELV